MAGLQLSPTTAAVGLAGLAVLGLALLVWRKGGVAPAAAAVGSAAVDAAGGVVSGAVGAVGSSVGLPTPAETVTDAAQARWLIDELGYFEASKWTGLPALLRGASMDSGSGTPPPASSPVMRAFGLVATRTARPTPAPVESYPPEPDIYGIAPYYAP